jgi:hypothetical protein
MHWVALGIWTARTGKAFTLLTSEECMHMLEATAHMAGVVQFPLSFLWSEWETMIEA